jgi:hypothetical protein
MIQPTEADIGRSVTYQGGHPDDRDEGVITSFNERYVFVRYRKQHPSAAGQATDPADLEWAHGR